MLTRGTMHADELAHAAREYFVRWIQWYLDHFPEEAGSQEQLAKRLGVSAPAIGAWRKKGSTRYPNMLNLLRFYVLLNKSYRVHLDTLLLGPPPRPLKTPHP